MQSSVDMNFEVRKFFLQLIGIRSNPGGFIVQIVFKIIILILFAHAISLVIIF